MSKFILSAFADEINENLQVQMEVLDKYGIRYIEMRGVNGKNITEHTTDEVREVRKQLDERGFGISAVGSPIGKIKITDDFTPHLERFKHTVEVAQILGTKYIRMFSFYIPKGEEPSKYKDEVMKRWSAFVKVVKGTSLVLLHENEKEIYGDTAKRCLDIINTMNCSYVKATFDPANFVQMDKEAYPDSFEILKDHIEYMHIKDALFLDHRVVPAGEGDGRVEEILSQLMKNGYEGFLSLEPHLAGFKGFNALELDAAAKSLPEGGPREFAIAFKALNKILDKLTGR
jgi:sugar phosphate isomerase/epimerase